MTPKQFSKYEDRDKSCWHCGQSADLIPHHRLNRGSGGKHAKADQVANIIVMCADFNGLMESSSVAAEYARARGWKLFSWQEPRDVPVYSVNDDQYYLLNNDYGRTILQSYLN